MPRTCRGDVSMPRSRLGLRARRTPLVVCAFILASISEPARADEQVPLERVDIPDIRDNQVRRDNLGTPGTPETPGSSLAGGSLAGSSLLDPAYDVVVTATIPRGRATDGRASSTVRSDDLRRRLPRSAPDALRYEPGVFVQQSAHGQGSAFVRGLTGQQTLLLFDGLRLNNSTYRQGPNQYFFTLDAQSIESIEVLRGGASTRYGSDALGGVIAAQPIAPSMKPPMGEGDQSLEARPKVFFRGATADDEFGGRAEINANVLEDLAFVGGLGGRRVGRLTSGGPVFNPADHRLPDVPRFASDGRTQLGTGFDELTFDGRAVYDASTRHRITVAGYGYQQYDAPRTDQCPPPGARFDECLTYDEQFRTLIYAAWDGGFGEWAETFRVTLSWQRQHERRTHARPASFVELIGRDDIHTLGITVNATASRWSIAPWLSLVLTYGADTYFDTVGSRAWLRFTDIDVTVERSRGQYLAGSLYLYGGTYLDLDARILQRLTFHGGLRASWIAARAPLDEASLSLAIRRAWFPIVGHVGAEWDATAHLTLLANLDRSFRAPNLDDLTSRQQTGPGFQFENASLGPEQATTLELGARVRTEPLTLEIWAFRTLIDGAVGKKPMEIADCPPDTPQCESSWFRYQLRNATGTAEILGLELIAQLRLPYGFTGRANAAWTRGEGPNLSDPPSEPSIPYERTVPLSRIPPLNGTAEINWFHTGVGAGAALRWALNQNRLAVADQSDARIPVGGTPGFMVFDLRLSYRLDDSLAVGAVFENVFDAAYRYHGSSVNGPGRGLVVSIALSPFLRHNRDDK
ncbi:MAG: TonB-dependent receptor [Deltaproteobacteria bacterium]|nr:TonB-dependent receptor [Deltaproteobacteria bacterium]